MLMSTRAGLTAALLVALTSVASAQEEPEPQIERSRTQLESDEALLLANQRAAAMPWLPTVQATLQAGAGAIDGATISPGRGAMSVLEGTLVSSLAHDRLSLELPIAAGTRQTFGASLSESHLEGDARGAFSFDSRFRVGADAGLAFVSRPNRPDPFQPVGATDLGGTSRYGHWDRTSGVDISYRPVRRERVRIRYDYTLAVYRRDPAFDAIYNPNHLAPWDQDTHRVDAAWRHTARRWNVGLGAELMRRQYFFTFAGDAITGINHAGPGGAKPNPLLRLRGANPRVEGAGTFAQGKLTLRAGYELELVQDVFAGYLSYVGQHPQMSLSWMLPRAIQLSAHAELFLRRYGVHSYARTDPNDLDHPPLGQRRYDRLGAFDLGLRMPLVPHWAVIANGSLVVRRTNYASYSVHWNYDNWIAWAGAEYAY